MQSDGNVTDTAGDSTASVIRVEKATYPKRRQISTMLLGANIKAVISLETSVGLHQTAGCHFAPHSDDSHRRIDSSLVMM